MKIFTRAMASIIFVTATALTLIAQEKPRRIERPAQTYDASTPINVKIKFDGIVKNSGEEFIASADWLQKISLEVENTSGKEIHAVLVDLILKEPNRAARQDTAEAAAVVLTIDLRHSSPRVEVLPAGAYATLKPPASVVQSQMNFARDTFAIQEFYKATLVVSAVAFTDDTMWREGRLSRKDPKSGNYIPVFPTAPSVTVPETILLESKLTGFFWKNNRS
jgi:hypothetical protein